MCISDQSSKNSPKKYIVLILIISLFSFLFVKYFHNHISNDFDRLPPMIQENHILSLLFRRSTWSFPISINAHLINKIPVALTDMIPLMAILYKIFNIESASYFGLWYIFSYILSLFFIYKIGETICKKWGGIYCCMLFLSLPVFWYHPMFISWFAGQWLILWSMWIFLRQCPRFSYEWYPILLISTMVHPYFVVVCFFMMLTDMFRVYTENYHISVQSVASQITHLLSLSISMFAILGLFYLPTFKVDSTTIPPLDFTPINRSEIKYRPSYLEIGMGIQLGCLVGLFFVLKNKKYEKLNVFFPYLFVSMLVLCSISGGIIIHGRIYRYYNLDSWISLYLTPLFASGSLYFIPILYLTPAFLCYSIYEIEKQFQYGGLLFLLVCLCLQHRVFSLPKISNSIISNKQELFSYFHGVKRIFWIFPKDIVYCPPEFNVFGYYAWIHNIDINAAPLIRFPLHYQKTLEKHRSDFTKYLFDNETIYILEQKDMAHDLAEFGNTLYTANLVIFKPFGALNDHIS